MPQRLRLEKEPEGRWAFTQVVMRIHLQQETQNPCNSSLQAAAVQLSCTCSR